MREKYKEIFMYLTYNIWRRKLNKFRKLFPEKRMRILECGCGQGFLLKFIEKWFVNFELLGLDINKEVLEVAKKKTKMTKFITAPATDIPMENSSVDIIFALHLLEHLTKPKNFLIEANRVLIDNGILIFATPNPKGVGARLMGGNWCGWSDKTHISLNPPIFWRERLLNNNFSILEEGTTGLSGIPMFRKIPIALINWVPLYLFGFFPWESGESYICIAKKTETIKR